MYTKSVFDNVKVNDEVVLSTRHSYVKGQVTKVTKTRLTVQYNDKTEQFMKTTGRRVGDGDSYRGRYIATNHAGRDDEGSWQPESLMTWKEAEVAIAKIEESNQKKADEAQERAKKAKEEFDQIIGKTNKYRNTLTLIDEFEQTKTYKVVIQSEKNKRIVGIFKVTPSHYYDFDTHSAKDGLSFYLTYSETGNNSWNGNSQENGETFEKVLDKVMYNLYRAW